MIAWLRLFGQCKAMHSLIDMREVASLATILASCGVQHITAQHFGVCGNFSTYRSPLTMKQRDVAFNSAVSTALDATGK